jgi:uncharacterized membrane protein YcjF (UPF0283 family)
VNAEQINALATPFALGMGIPWFLFTVIYGLLSPWFRSLLGTVMFLLGLSITLVFANIVARRVWGEFAGYEWWALGIYAFGLLTATAFVVIVVVELARGGVLTILLKRKKI